MDIQYWKIIPAAICLVLMNREIRSAQLPAAPCLPPGASPPNILVLLADDQGWGDVTGNGNPDIETPHLDQLATQGARFDRFFVCPVCSPTRAEFLTGRYHTRMGVWGTSEGMERFNTDETTIAQLLQQAGYATAAFGKWHSGTQFPYHPNARGFDEFYGFTSGHWGDYYSPMLDHNGRIVKGDGFLANDLTNKAMEFIGSRRGQPFFVYVPYNLPHSPMQVPGEWWDKFKDKDLDLPTGAEAGLDHARAALAMCENIDWNVGRLLDQLDRLGLAENTIVVYFSDNGPNGHRWNGGMRGIKGSTDEGGIRSPLFIRWPGHIPAGTTVRSICADIDLLPTLLDLAGVQTRGLKPLDGISLKAPLLGHKGAPSDRLIFSHWSRKVSVRTQQYRLDDRGRLYDMVTDPGQSMDIADRQSGVAARLRQAVAGWREEMLVGYGIDERPLVIGYPRSVFTQLPARDGFAEGNITRSNRWPNCSFFTNWTSVDDAITWPCQVAQPGNYQVEIYYTCAPDDVGSTIELSFNNARLQGQVSQSNDPPLTGMEHDRVLRMESYVKDFRPMDLGRIKLESGSGPLRLQALDIPGSRVMDFRMMVLTRIP